MKILGIDPGATDSHAALITRNDDGYHVEHVTILTTNVDRPHAALWDLHAHITRLATDHAPQLAAIEIARGQVYAGRSGDGVLRNNLAAGAITGLLTAAGIPTIHMPPSGLEAGVNWRDQLGVRKHTDAGVRDAIHRLMPNPDLPTGTRGGHIAHYWDAAGIAIAAHERMQRLGIEPTFSDLPTALMTLTPLERAAQQQPRRRGRKGRRR